MAGVDFDFTLHDEASGNITKITGGLNELLSQLKLVNGATGKVEASGKKFNAAGVGASALGNIIAGVALKAAGAAVALARMGQDAVIALGEATLEAAKFGQETKLALGNLLPHGADVQKEFNEITALAANMGLNVQDTAHQFQKLLAAQFSVGQSKALIKMGADLQGIGVTADKVGGVLLTMTQIKSKGKLQGEELMQLQEAGVSGELIFKQLEKATGKTRDEVQKLLSAGKIDASTGLNAIGEAIKAKAHVKEFGELGQKFADTTLTGMGNKIKGKFDLLFIKAGERVLPILEKTLGPIGAEISGFLDSPAGAKTIDAIAAGFEAVGGAIQVAWPFVKQFFSVLGSGLADQFAAIGRELSGLDFGKAMGSGGGFMSFITMAAKGLVAFIGYTARVVIGITVFALALASAAGKVYAFGSSVVGAITGLPGMVGNATLSIAASVIQLGTDLLASGTQAASNLISGLANGIRAGIGIVVDAVRSVGTSAVGALSSIWQSHSPSVVFEEKGYTAPQGIVRGVRRGEPEVQSAIADIAEPLDPRRRSLVAGGGAASMFAPQPTSEPRAAASIRIDGGVHVHLDGNPSDNVKAQARDLAMAIKLELENMAFEPGL